MINLKFQQQKQDNIEVILCKKAMKQKVFPSLMIIDKEAFAYPISLKVMSHFWESHNNKILIARKKDT